MRARFVEPEVKREGKAEDIEILPNSGDVCLSLSYYRISEERERERERERGGGGYERSTIITKSNFAGSGEKTGKEEPLSRGFLPRDGWTDSNFQHSSQL